MSKLFGYGILLFFSVASVSAGVFFVGGHFLKKSNDYEDQRAEAREQASREQRKKNVSFAKEANADDYEIKKLRERLKKETHEKNSSFKDLKKIVAQSECDLKLWYFAENDEDLEQARAYATLYLGRVEEFQKFASAAQAERERHEKELDELAAQSDAQTEIFRTLQSRQERLAEESRRATALWEKAKNELAGTPAFRRAKAEKNVRLEPGPLSKLQASAVALLSEIKQNEERFNFLSRQIERVREKSADAAARQRKYAKESLLCESAWKITREIVKNAEKIKALKAEILELEYSRDDKNIEARF